MPRHPSLSRHHRAVTVTMLIIMMAWTVTAALSGVTVLESLSTEYRARPVAASGPPGRPAGRGGRLGVHRGRRVTSQGHCHTDTEPRLPPVTVSHTGPAVTVWLSTVRSAVGPGPCSESWQAGVLTVTMPGPAAAVAGPGSGGPAQFVPLAARPGLTRRPGPGPTGNQFQKPIENVAYNSERPHRFGLV